jgi:predicted kinase
MSDNQPIATNGRTAADVAAERQLRRSPDSHTIVVQMHGEPGSGKSTLARALAPCIGALVLDKDIIKSALLRCGAPEALAASAAYETYFDLARSYVAQGHSIILDNPVFWSRVEERWLELSAEAGCPPTLIECQCLDRDELVHRLRTRAGSESQPREPLDLTRYPASRPTSYEPRVRIDTTRPLADCVEDAVAYVNLRIAAPVGRPR